MALFTLINSGFDYARCVQDLEIIAKAGDPEDLMNGIMFLPL